jgi:hypothetical protein
MSVLVYRIHVYRIHALLAQVLARVPLGTNLGLCHLLFALMSGRFLMARGAVFPALADLGLPDDAVRRAAAALCYGRWHTPDLLAGWQKAVAREGRFVPCEYEGVRPVACDLTAFFRPQARGLDSKHYVSEAGKALPAVVLGLCAQVGRVGGLRLGLPRLVLRRKPGESEADLQRRLVGQAAQRLAPAEALVLDAGFGLADLLSVAGLRFVARARSNQTARRGEPPPYRGRGRRPTRGLLVRPLARTRAGKTIAATPPDATQSWADGGRRLRAEVWSGLVLPDAAATTATFRLVAIHDPRYGHPLLLSTNLDLSAQALWHLYKDRWAVEQLPLSAKPMLGAERAFVSGQQSRYRLPELALLAGNLLSYFDQPGCGGLRHPRRRGIEIWLLGPGGPTDLRACAPDALAGEFCRVARTRGATAQKGQRDHALEDGRRCAPQTQGRAGNLTDGLRHLTYRKLKVP